MHKSMPTKTITLLLAACYLQVAQSQTLPYSDADTPGQAVGMMSASIVTARKMLSECSARFPESSEVMKRQFENWQKQESEVLRKTKLHWQRVLQRDPKLVEFEPYLENMVTKNIENIANAPHAAASNGAREYCLKHFDDLASGVWRLRTPKVFEYMDRAPG